jgi:hypothetical protein
MRSPLSHHGENNGRAVLTEEDVLHILRLWAEGKHSQRTLAKLFGVGHRTIVDILQKRTWAHLWHAEKE